MTKRVGDSSAPLKERLFRRVSKRDDGCWMWTGHLNNFGYGRISIGDRRSCLVHRVSYEIHIGPIPEGKVLDHLCRVRHCVNPAHLEPVSARQNVRRSELTVASINAAKTHCPHGHPYSPENTMVRQHATHLERVCRTCVKARRSRLAAAS